MTNKDNDQMSERLTDVGVDNSCHVDTLVTFQFNEHRRSTNVIGVCHFLLEGLTNQTF